MARHRHNRFMLRLWVAALFGLAFAIPVWGQEEPGDQRFRFGISQTFEAQDNIRLAPESAGTTYSSDTRLSFGFDTETAAHALSMSAETVARLVNDPITGRDSGFRDHRVDLGYRHDSANSQTTLDLSYSRPDLAFNDSLERNSITAQDFFRGGGTREDIDGTFRYETGLTAPLDFYFELDRSITNFQDTVDPVLFDNRTDRADAGLRFQVSPVLEGRFDVSQQYYQAEDSRNSETDTRRVTLGLDYEISRIAGISLDIGNSEVTETLDNPDEKPSFSGPVATLEFRRDLPNGVMTVIADTRLSELGRQSEFEIRRNLELATGALAFSLGLAQGDTFDPRPIGSIAYAREGRRSQFDIALSRTASISDIIREATEETRLDLGYDLAVNPISTISLDIFYADITVVGDEGTGRDRGSLYATYTRAITEDWDLNIGYEYRFTDESGDIGRGVSNGVFFTLERVFEVFR